MLTCWIISWKCVPLGVDLLISCYAVGKLWLGDTGTLTGLVVGDVLLMKGFFGETVGPDPLVGMLDN